MQLGGERGLLLARATGAPDAAPDGHRDVVQPVGVARAGVLDGYGSAEAAAADQGLDLVLAEDEVCCVCYFGGGTGI